VTGLVGCSQPKVSYMPPNPRASYLTINYIANKIFNVELINLVSNLRVLKLSLLEPPMSSTKIFEYINKVDSYHNVSIAYQIVFTIPVMVASNKRSFSMMK
jgi:hypothetical protein